ncbi:chemotaxis protein CheW [Azospirillum sp.]|uniref:chemotaxis protein CheW n=1 Tax=Azospirillum sp. TaxID=34012 RepID=UPI003D7346C7
MPNTAPPLRAPATPGCAAEPDRLSLQAGGRRWSVPAADVLCIAEPPAELSPIPHAPSPIAGLSGIEGRVFTVLDLAPGSAGGALVVVASGTGGLALRVEAVGRGADDAPPLADLLADIAPWAPPPAAGRTPSLRPVQAAAPARRVPFLLVAGAGTTAALPVERVGRVGVVSAVQPLRGGDALVRVDGDLLPARRLAEVLPTVPGAAGDPRWAVVLRGDGQESALLVDRVVGLEPCDPRSIAAVTLPDGRPQRWLNRPDADPVPVLDPILDDRAPPPAPDAEPARDAPSAADAVLTVQAGDLRLALPLALVDRILDSAVTPARRPAPGLVPVFDMAVALGRRSEARIGALVSVRAADGAPLLLSVDRVLALSPPVSWQPVAPLPPAAALAFEAAGRDETGWLFRLRRDLPSPAAVPRHLRRPLAAARLGWADPAPPV